MKAYIFLFLLLGLVVGEAKSQANIELHVVYLGAYQTPYKNALDAKLGDLALPRTRAVMQDIAYKIGAKLVSYEICDNTFSKAHFDNTLATLMAEGKRANTTKILLIVGALHGVNFEQTNSQIPHLILTHGKVEHQGNLVDLESTYDQLRLRSNFDFVHIWVEACNGADLVDIDDLPQARNTPTLSPQDKGGEHILKLLSSEKSTLILPASYGQKAVPMILFYACAISLNAVEQNRASACFSCDNGFFDQTRKYSLHISSKVNWHQTPMFFAGAIPQFVPPAQTNAGSGSALLDVLKPNLPAAMQK